MTLVDLCGLPVEEAQGLLVALREEMTACPERWKYDHDHHVWGGVRVVVGWVARNSRGYKETESPLEDPRKWRYGLHPDFGFTTCWFTPIDDCTPRMMYVVRPDPEIKRPKLKLVS